MHEQLMKNQPLLQQHFWALKTQDTTDTTNTACKRLWSPNEDTESSTLKSVCNEIIIMIFLKVLLMKYLYISTKKCYLIHVREAFNAVQRTTMQPVSVQ